MIGRGILASELIAKLNKMIDTYGDKQVYAGGADYPAGVRGVFYQKDEYNPYVPKGTFRVS